jgi:hypothetical protein
MLSEHLANKSIERSLDRERPQVNTSISNGLGLPPSGQNIVQKSITIDKTLRDTYLKHSQEFTINALKRNFSTNQLQQNEENSRNRLGNRKSIPATFRDEEFTTFQATDRTVQIMSSRQRREETSNTSRNDVSLNNTQPFLKKAESENVTKPPIQDSTKQFHLKNFNNAGQTMARTMSRGKLGIDQPGSFRFTKPTHNLAPEYKLKELMERKKRAGNHPMNRDSITPKNNEHMPFANFSRNCTRRTSINNLKGAPDCYQQQNNGSVTNRTQVNPLQMESMQIPSQKILYKNPSSAMLSSKEYPSKMKIKLGSMKTMQGSGSKQNLTLDARNQKRISNFPPDR